MSKDKSKAKQPPKVEDPMDELRDDPTVIKDDTPFPAPDLYFKVFESEEDEPQAKIDKDVYKLYDRWQEKYGRRWPENGLETEDLVWLAEEANKPTHVLGEPVDPNNPLWSNRPVNPEEMGLVPAEKVEYPNQFIDERYADASSTSAPAAGADDGKGSKPGAAAAQTAAGKAAPKPAAAGKGASAGKPGAGAASAASASSAAGSASASASSKPGAGNPKHLSNYEATKAGANWVTDEFESEEYEAGNLEQLWGTYLKDQEGDPLFMPKGPPDEAQGEESEDFADFHGSYRPRHVDSDEVREAVWATDEFESDEDNTESEWEPEYVGAGLGLKVEDPINPQYSLRHSNHPLAPFPGEALKWSSYVYDDGTTFEGLTRDDIPHGMGVMVFGNGTGGGFHFRDVRRGDKYEGEFQVGYAHGLGQFTSETRGEVYIGEFFGGQKHGCGIKINMKPFYYLLERGATPLEAYQRVAEDMVRNIVFRTWFRNKPLGSDYEDETIFYAIQDEFDHPLKTIARAELHEAKLKSWQKMDPIEKAMTKLVDIVEAEGVQRRAARNAALGGDEYFVQDGQGRLTARVDEYGEDSDHDSIDLMVGNQTDGDIGLGWLDDVLDSSEFPMDPKLAEVVAADVVEDRGEESEDKEALLGDDIVNPYTGLNLKDYLEGKEGRHKEMVAKAFGGLKDYEGYAQQYQADKLLNTPVNRALADPHSSTMEVPVPEGGKKLSGREQAALQEVLDAYDREEAEAAASRGRRYGKDKAPGAEDTDTRFETESEMMEMCDLAEILGTVQEAREIVSRARMWRWKPAGEVTLRFAQDANGAPVDLMQDPLHYPHGTKFMAPGPLGQVHPVPQDPALRGELASIASFYQSIHDMYNFDYDPQPGTAQYTVDQRIKRALDLHKRRIARLDEAVSEELAADEAPAAPGPQLVASVADASASGSDSSSSHWSFLPRWGAPSPVPAGGSGTPYAPFASMSFGMGRASRAVLKTLERAARHAPSRRPHIIRPSQLRQKSQQQQQQQQQ